MNTTINNDLQNAEALANFIEEGGRTDLAKYVRIIASKKALIDKTLTEKEYTCIVCEKTFQDTWHHVTGESEGLLEFIDKPHQDYFKKVLEYNMDHNGVSYLKCFCGGIVKMSGLANEGWETTCLTCEFLFDED